MEISIFPGYLCVPVLSYRTLFFTILVNTPLNLLFCIVWSYFFVLMLWKNESKSIFLHYHITTKTEVKEKWLLTTGISIPLYFPLYAYYGLTTMFLGFGGLYRLFVVGFVVYTTKKNRFHSRN